MQEKACLPNWYNNSSHTYMQTHSDKYVSESMLGSKVFFSYNLYIVAQVIGFKFTCEAHVRVRFLVTKFVLIRCSNGERRREELTGGENARRAKRAEWRRRVREGLAEAAMGAAPSSPAETPSAAVCTCRAA